MTLRPYQQDCITATEKAFGEHDRLLDVMPTGSGKTVVFSHLAQNRAAKGQRTLILAHRDELVAQAREKLESATGIKADREKAGDYASMDCPVVVASVQTLMRQKRLERWPKDHFALVVSDEAHRILAPSWMNTLRHFNAQHLGVTATPKRGDQKDLGVFYQKKAYEISLRELINQGYLSRIVFRNLPLRIDLSNIQSETDPETGCRDFSRKATAVRLEQYLPQLAQCLARDAQFRRTLVFAPLVDTCRKGVEAFRAVGLSADYVHGDDPERESKLDRFRNWEFDFLWNADLLKEGYDDPGIDCVCFFRPTRVSALFWQAIGRGTRIAEGKQNLLVLDPLYMNAEHPPMGAYCLVAGDDFEAEQIRDLAGNGKSCPPDREFDLLDLKIEAENQREKALVRRLEQVKDNDPKVISLEEFAILHKSLRVAEYADTMPADNAPVTDKQREWLEKVRVHPRNGSVFLRYAPKIAKPLDVSKVKTAGQASEILSVCFASKNQGVAMASDKVKAIMRRKLGYVPEHVTAEQGRKFFADLKKERATKQRQREMAL